MLTHYKFDNPTVVGQAEGMAYAINCVERGLASGELVYAYGYAVSKLYSVSVYDKELYEFAYEEKKSELSNSLSSGHLRECSRIATDLPEMTENVFRQYASITQSRQEDVANLSQSLGSIKPAMPYNQQPISVSSPKADFGLKENKTKHYLVNFGSGQRICTATSSGYVFCR
jgi:hypothetical protein